jgi:hypothetical protein
MIERGVIRKDIESVILAGETIEDYPRDKYGPTCLIYGRTPEGRDLHVHVSWPPNVVVITVYDPDPSEWIGCRTRR